MLSKDYKERKALPVATGVLDYFPDALVEVAHVSYVGNEQHNPGEPLHWNRAKSTDEADALLRHFIERGQIDTDGVRHSAKVAWRALALLQKELEDVARQAVDAPGDSHFDLHGPVRPYQPSVYTNVPALPNGMVFTTGPIEKAP